MHIVLSWNWTWGKIIFRSNYMYLKLKLGCLITFKIIHLFLSILMKRKWKFFFVKFSSIEFRYNISRSLNRVFHVARLIKVWLSAAWVLVVDQTQLKCSNEETDKKVIYPHITIRFLSGCWWGNQQGVYKQRNNSLNWRLCIDH